MYKLSTSTGSQLYNCPCFAEPNTHLSKSNLHRYAVDPLRFTLSLSLPLSLSLSTHHPTFLFQLSQNKLGNKKTINDLHIFIFVHILYNNAPTQFCNTQFGILLQYKLCNNPTNNQPTLNHLPTPGFAT